MKTIEEFYNEAMVDKALSDDEMKKAAGGCYDEMYEYKNS